MRTRITTALVAILSMSILASCEGEKKIDEKTQKEANDFSAQLKAKVDSLNTWFAEFKNTKQAWQASRNLDSVKMALDAVKDPALRTGWEMLYSELQEIEAGVGKWDGAIQSDIDAVANLDKEYSQWFANASAGKLNPDSAGIQLQSWKAKLVEIDNARQDWNTKWQQFAERDKEAIAATRPLLDKLKK